MKIYFLNLVPETCNVALYIYKLLKVTLTKICKYLKSHSIKNVNKSKYKY